MEEKILKLLGSTNKGDILIGLNLLGNIDYRAFVKKYGTKYYAGENRYYRYLDPTVGPRPRFYYRITQEFYILIDYSYHYCQCDYAYNDSVEVINH